MNLHAWRRAIAGPGGPHPTTRLVLLTLSLRMKDPPTDGCWPSLALLEAETGLTRRTLADHLTRARAAGWVAVRPSGTGQGWRRQVYHPTFPDPDHVPERAGGDRARSAQREFALLSPVDNSVDRPANVGKSTQQRGEIHDVNVGKSTAPRTIKRTIK